MAVVSKEYRHWAPEQAYLFPPSPREWLPEGHLANFVLDVVRELDLGAIEAAIQKKDPRGERPYAPKMMTALLLYGYCVGVYSSRKLERATYEDVATRVIAGECHPHFTTINTFRLEHREALAELFLQVLKLCRRAGLVKMGHVALDGTKVQANASKHKAMTYRRMTEEEKRLSAEIEVLLERADDADIREDAKYGRGKRGDELPEELRFRESRLRRIREAKEKLQEEGAAARAAELRENAAALRKKADEIGCPPKERVTAETLAAKSDKRADELAPRDDDDDDGGTTTATELPKHRIATTPDGTPKDDAQRNFTDAESRIMVRNGVFMQAYNAQAVVTEEQIIVAHGLTNTGADAEQLVPMLARTRENCGRFPDTCSADNGYLSQANASYCDAHGVEALLGVKKKDNDPWPPTTDSAHMRFAMRLKLLSTDGKAKYERRKVMIEPVFGQIKSAMGFRRLSLRGLAKAASEWGIVATCHNLLKLFRASLARLATAAA